MTKIAVDFSDVEQVDRTPIKAGKYDVVIEDVTVAQAEGKPHPYLNFKLSITDGEHEGRNLYMIRSLSPAALGFLQELFQSFGLDEDDYELEADDDTNQLLEPDMIGLTGVATVRNQLYDGRPQARVLSLIGEPPTKKTKKRKPVEDDDEDEEEDEEEEEKPKKKAAAGGGKKPPTRTRVAAAEEDDDDEEEEEEETKPARRPLKAKSKTAAKTPATKRRFR